MTTDQQPGTPELTGVRSEHRFDENALYTYIAEHGLVDKRLSVRQFEGGQSNPTFLLEADGRRYVLRKQPPGDILPSAHRVDREYKVMAALADAPGVPVPTMHLFCDDASIIGTPFYVMDYVPGQVFSDPALPELDPEARRRVHHGLIDTMAAMHSVDVEAAGLAEFGKPAGYIERQIKLWRRQYEASTDRVDTNMTQLGDWLAEHIPADPPPAIAHGDFRIGNLLMAEDVSQVVAVLDWELATLGHPLADLAYACMPYYLPPDTIGIAGLEGLDLDILGIPDEAAQIARYRAARGLGPIEDWPVFVAFALYRMAAILQGVAARAQAGNASSENALAVGSRAGLMAERGWQVARGYD
ncbi:phosphotransferase family protein [Salinisphaera sp. SPP-AMP-43]|uniref:phosphotransferase family protein n=1 Tax=Salinisphaera sp. SPP-AMP-43 TaxID=3121288 RepID=UPI003C6DDD78